ncbi:hypothetical protein Tco_0929020 [Tanacetum coccineum]
MGEVLQFSSINNLQVLLFNEGFHNTRIVYLGGLWVMIELNSSKSKLKFMEHVGVASWFRSLGNAQSDFAAKERIVWVDIEGVPLNAWSRSTFQKIGSKWGELVVLEDGYEDLFARKRICIMTSHTEIHTWKKFYEQELCSDDESIKANEEANNLNLGDENDSEVVSDIQYACEACGDSVGWLFVTLVASVWTAKMSKLVRFLVSEQIMVQPPLGCIILGFLPSGFDDMVWLLGYSFVLADSMVIEGLRLKWAVEGDGTPIFSWFPSRLTADQISDLEISSVLDEISKRCRSCGENKSPGPDGFTFEFFRKYWDSIGPDIQDPDRDPLAPYLFILVMESLHLSVSRTVEAGIFTGIKIDSALSISHLFYADDAVFIGVGVTGSLVNEAAASIGCSVMKAPFKYLGVMVGGEVPFNVPFPRLYAHPGVQQGKFSCGSKCKAEIGLALFVRHVRGGVEISMLEKLSGFG